MNPFVKAFLVTAGVLCAWLMATAVLSVFAVIAYMLAH